MLSSFKFIPAWHANSAARWPLKLNTEAVHATASTNLSLREEQVP